MVVRRAFTSRPPDKGQLQEIVTQADDRFVIHEALGRGGMATVYAATDRCSGRHVAVKRLRESRPEHAQRDRELFEREFHTLAQLGHPCVIRVYDFGVDRAGPFYTMELLEGTDLQQLGKLPWRTACAIARHVCSALSLLHSRRLVHRDVSPRNVHRGRGGGVKLIDFGAVVPVGTSKVLMGTPPCCAPESLQLQPLDGRTDLFGLGATLYHMLVGWHAYAARHFSALPDAWLAGFVRPSQLASDIPEALDEIVLDLLRLEPDARPASAAEVLQRLAAIDGSPQAEEGQIARAYLTTPVLVGRRQPLARAARRMRRAARGELRSIVIDGPAGMGRSRFLDACLLEATLLGASVLRVDAEDGAAGNYAAVRALAQQVLNLMPQIAIEVAQPMLPALARALPALAPQLGTQRAAPAGDPKTSPQQALRDWFSALSQRRALVIAVDDIHRIDASSAALLVSLALQSTAGSLCLVVSTDRDDAWSTHVTGKALLEVAMRVSLEPLTQAQSRQLLQSLFGDVPNLDLLARHAQASCGGNPRDLMALAQHLLDRGLVRFEAGVFSLPVHIDDHELPSSLAQALRARAAALSEPARELACALALCPDLRLSFGQCAQLCSGGPARGGLGVHHVLDELIRTEVARVAQGQVGLSQQAWIPILSGMPSAEQARALHERIALALSGCDDDQFFVARHFTWAGQAVRALDGLLEYCRVVTARAAQRDTIAHLRQAHGWLEIYEHALRACDDLGRPRVERFTLQSRIVGLNALFGIHETVHLSDVLRQLSSDSGLDDYRALDPDTLARDRVVAALRAAHARHRATAERDRVREPSAALAELGTTIVSALGTLSPALDLTYLQSLPDLTPFVPLSAALGTVARLADSLRARLQGRLQQARRLYVEVLQRVERPDRSGLTPFQAAYLRLSLTNLIATLDAGSGKNSCVQLAQQLEQHPHYQYNGVRIRRLHALFQGDLASATSYRKHADRLRMQSSQNEMHPGLHLLWEIDAHAICEDLTHLRQTVDELAPLAKRYPAWIPVLRYATAEYHRIRHAGAKAQAEIEAALELTRPGGHQLWPGIACSHVLLLHDLGRYQEAVVRADAYVAAAEALLDEPSERLLLARALVRSSAGDPSAAAHADEVIDRLRVQGVTGLYLGLAHETRARIALSFGDGAAFERHAQGCCAAYCDKRHPALIAKYQRLLFAARGAEHGARFVSGTPPDAP